MSIILTILAFNFIIIVHELGHFLIARWNGIKVLEFSLFVGPKLWSTKRGDTEYSLRLIPILAYVQMEGEEESSDDENAFSNKSVWARMAVVAGGPFANLLSALAILVIVFSISGYNTTILDEIESKSPAYIAGLQEGDKIISYNGKRVYLPSDVVQFAYIDKGEPATITVLRDGVKKDVEIEPLIINQDRYILGFEAKKTAGESSTIVKSTTDGYPAKEAGLLRDDKIIALNGESVESLYDVIKYVEETKGKEIKLTVIRNNQELVIPITPKLIKDRPSINMGISFKENQDGILGITGHSLKYIWANVRNVGYSLKWLCTGKVSISQMSGPVGIVTVMNDATKEGINFKEKFIDLLSMTAYIDIAIGATNLVPFPALDGNKLLLLMLEVVRRKPISPEKENKISLVGLAVLMVLMLITTSNDIISIIQRIRG